SVRGDTRAIHENIQQPTSNIEHPTRAPLLSMLDVGCWLLVVRFTRWSMVAHPPHHGDMVGLATFSVRSLFHVIRNTNPTPVQMALSATLKAGKPISSPPRWCR